MLPPLYTDEPVQDGEREVTLRRVGDTQWLSAMYHTVPGAHPDATAIAAAVDAMTVSPGGRLYKALVETKKAAAVDDFVYTGCDPGFAMFLAQVPEDESLDAARDDDAAGDRGRGQAADQRSGSRPRARQGAEVDRRDDQRSAAPRRRAFGVDRGRRLAPVLPAARPLARADARRRRSASPPRTSSASNRTVGEFIPDAKPDRAPAPPTVDVAAMVKDYKGDPAVAAGETFDATPANLDARAQRFTLANGMKVALLPKKTRGETVHFYLSMHYGDEASINGPRRRGSTHRRAC